MTEGIEVAVVHGIKITYDAEKKHFLARVGGRDIKKASQRDVEKIISKFVKGDQRTKGIILDYGWRSVLVIPVEIVGMRGSKVQYRKGDYLETEDADKTYVHDDAILAKAKILHKEHDDWLKRWEALVEKAKPVDVEAIK